MGPSTRGRATDPHKQADKVGQHLQFTITAWPAFAERNIQMYSSAMAPSRHFATVTIRPPRRHDEELVVQRGLTAWNIESPIEPLRELVRRNRGVEARHAIDGQHRTRLLRRAAVGRGAERRVDRQTVAPRWRRGRQHDAGYPGGRRVLRVSYRALLR